MSISSEKLLVSTVMHKRLRPKKHGFSYPVFYLAFPLSRVGDVDRGGIWFGVNRRALISFREQDYLPQQENNDSPDQQPQALQNWVRKILADAEVKSADGEIVLVTMPRILGYLFNPVNFFFCYDLNGQLRAVLSQVNNTFGETHNYLCVRPDGKDITGVDWIVADKQFHVSPFFERHGNYQFRFDEVQDRLTIQINYLDDDGESNLLTSVTGSLVDFNRRNLKRAFWRHPMQTLMVTLRIHWHALRLWRKGVAYIPKPKQYLDRLTKARSAFSKARLLSDAASKPDGETSAYVPLEQKRVS